jgi:hypothetical protein
MQQFQPYLSEPYRAHLRLVFKYGCTIGNSMVAERRTLFILAVMLLAPFASAVDSPPSQKNNILQDAAANWHSMEPVDSFQSPLKNVDFQIHLAVGSFDPLTDKLPESRLDDSQDYRQTGMAIVQLNHHTGSSLYNLVDEYGVFILDNLGGSSWLVRLSHPNDLSTIQQDDSVRWAGSMMPGWRVSPDVLRQQATFLQFLQLI